MAFEWTDYTERCFVEVVRDPMNMGAVVPLLGCVAEVLLVDHGSQILEVRVCSTEDPPPAATAIAWANATIVPRGTLRKLWEVRDNATGATAQFVAIGSAGAVEQARRHPAFKGLASNAPLSPKHIEGWDYEC